MKSTGEVLGISKNLDEAIYKAFMGTGIQLPKRKNIICTIKDSSKEESNKSNFLNKSKLLSLNYIFIVAISIVIGEFGDKTFLASLGLGIQYPNYKIPLILGSITGMVLSDSLAIFFGKLLGSKISTKFIEFISNCIFLCFGLIGLFLLFINKV